MLCWKCFVILSNVFYYPEDDNIRRKNQTKKHLPRHVYSYVCVKLFSIFWGNLILCVHNINKDKLGKDSYRLQMIGNLYIIMCWWVFEMLWFEWSVKFWGMCTIMAVIQFSDFIGFLCGLFLLFLSMHVVGKICNKFPFDSVQVRCMNILL